MLNMKSSLCALSAVLIGATICLGDVPSGQYEYTFDTNNAPLWDLSGEYELEQDIIGSAGQETPVKFVIIVEHDAKGRLIGAGSSEGMIGDSPVGGEYRVLGRVLSSSGGLVKVKLVVRYRGEGVIGGVPSGFRINVTHHLELNGLEQKLVGRAKGSAKFGNLANGPIRSESEVELEEDNDGHWTLGLEVIPVKKLGGNAIVALPSGRSLPFSLKVSYSESSDSSKLKLKGFGSSKGLNFTLRTSGEEMALDRIKGKALGQKIKLQAD